MHTRICLFSCIVLDMFIFLLQIYMQSFVVTWYNYCVDLFSPILKLIFIQLVMQIILTYIVALLSLSLHIRFSFNVCRLLNKDMYVYKIFLQISSSVWQCLYHKISYGRLIPKFLCSMVSLIKRFFSSHTIS